MAGRVTNAQLAVMIGGTNKRLDSINGTLKEHAERLTEHDVRIAEMSVEEKHHSVNWDRLISVGVAIVTAITIGHGCNSVRSPSHV